MQFGRLPTLPPIDSTEGCQRRDHYTRKYSGVSQGMSSEIPARLPVLAFGWFQDNDNPHIRWMKM
jgi:hypothetical protein